jgi:hypothetical protein
VRVFDDETGEMESAGYPAADDTDEPDLGVPGWADEVWLVIVTPA